MLTNGSPYTPLDTVLKPKIQSWDGLARMLRNPPRIIMTVPTCQRSVWNQDSGVGGGVQYMPPKTSSFVQDPKERLQSIDWDIVTLGPDVLVWIEVLTELCFSSSTPEETSDS